MTGWTLDGVRWRGVRFADLLAAAKPLPDAPVRVVIPEMYGYKKVKWGAEVNLVAEPAAGCWERLGYDNGA